MEYKRNDQNENGLRRRRRRHWNNANDNPNHDTIWNDSNIHNGETKETFVLTFNSILWIPILLHMISIVTILNGIYLRFSLHNGSDCEMTYSHRHFVPIHISNSKSPYKLYKFIDERDPRWTHLMSEPKSFTSHCGNNNNNNNGNNNNNNNNNNHTNTKTHIVLYIPGHWGSYTQCRSIGAHGVQLTGIQEKTEAAQRLLLHQEIYHGMAELEQHFVYDTYCIDFSDQGGGLHGSLLQAQRDYVEQVVSTLIHTCSGSGNNINNSSSSSSSSSGITMVGHSIGGLVATRTRVTRMRMANVPIVTLATPHAGFPYGMDESIREFYQETQLSNDDRIVISISGGLKDEMIPSSLCELKIQTSSAITVQASDIMTIKKQEQGNLQLGMDHKAIVWCHNLLSVVRTNIFQLSRAERNGVPKQDQLATLGMKTQQSYSSSVQQQKRDYRNRFGTWSLLCVESAMLYHVELLLGLFTMNCCFQHVILQTAWKVFIPLIAGTMAFVSMNHDICFGATIVLSFVASAVLASILVLASWLRRLQWWLVGLMTILAIGCRVTLLPLVIVTFVSETVMVAMFVLWTGSVVSLLKGRCCFDALVVVTFPCLVAGKVVAYLWSFQQELNGLNADLVRFFVVVMIPIGVRLNVRANSSKIVTNPFLLAWLFGLVSIAFSVMGIFKVGGIYLAGYYMSSLSVVDVVLLASAKR